MSGPVGFVGLGVRGWPIARNLVATGRDVSVTSCLLPQRSAGGELGW